MRRVESVVIELGHGFYRATRGGDQRRRRPRRRRHAGRHPDAVQVAARHRQRRRQPGPQFGDQVGVARPVLRHRVDPPVHMAVDRLDGDAEHRRPGPATPTTADPRRRRCGRRSSPNRPNDSRTSSTLPRRPHLRDDSVIALACNRSPAGHQHPGLLGQRRAARQRQRHQRRRRHRDASRRRRGARGDARRSASAAAAPGRPAPPRRRASAAPRRRPAPSPAARG